MPRRAAAAAFLVSVALLLVQVSFTRLLSYRLYYHFVFLAVSVTLLGLGSAGSFAAARPLPAGGTDRSVRAWLAALLVLLPAAFAALANPIPIVRAAPDTLKLLGRDAALYLAWVAPFLIAANFCGGMALTRLFAAYPGRMGLLYGADLAGAGAGCLLAVWLMNQGSPPVAFLAAGGAVLAALAPFLFAPPPDGTRRSWPAPAAAALGLGATAFLLLGPERLRDFQNFRTSGPRPAVVKHEWNHLIRTDHIGGHYVLDGDASTPAVVWSEAERARPVTNPALATGVLAPSVAVIGCGGGPEVAEALRAGAPRILAIDINPVIARWVRGEDRALNLGLFDGPRVELVVSEGRHAIRAREERFDAILMHAIDTYAATATGAYALTENFLYTKEALQEYHAALKPGGVMTISRWLFNPPRENLRLFVTAIEALKELGVPEPRRHLVMIAPVPDYALVRGKRVWGYLLLARDPFTPERVERLRAHAQAQSWSLLCAPGIRCDTPFDAYVRAADRPAFRAAYPFNIEPVTDSSPYLFQFHRPLRRGAPPPATEGSLSAVYRSSSDLLPLAFGASVVLSLLIILAPLAVGGRGGMAGAAAATADPIGAAPSGDGVQRNFPPALPLREALFFAGLGVGYMALEIPLIQVLSLQLGHPTYGFTVALAGLLLSTGAGSLASGRFRTGRRCVCLIVAGMLALLALYLFPFVRATLRLPDAARFPLALLLAAVHGLPMGMPLAMGIRELGTGEGSSRRVAWAWAVNGSASVIGSCGVMLVLVFSGSRPALLLGAASYLLAAAAARPSRGILKLQAPNPK